MQNNLSVGNEITVQCASAIQKPHFPFSILLQFPLSVQKGVSFLTLQEKQSLSNHFVGTLLRCV